MVYSPDRKPLSECTDEELKKMEKTANKNVSFSSKDITEELRYREQNRIAYEQRRVAESMRKIVTAQAVIAGVAVVVAVLVAATNLAEFFT